MGRGVYLRRGGSHAGRRCPEISTLDGWDNIWVLLVGGGVWETVRMFFDFCMDFLRVWFYLFCVGNAAKALDSAGAQSCSCAALERLRFYYEVMVLCVFNVYMHQLYTINLAIAM